MSVVSVDTTSGTGPETFRVPDGYDEARADPTGTARIRQLLANELVERWDSALDEIPERIEGSLATDASETTHTRLRALREVLRETLNEIVLEPLPTTAVKRGEHWTAKYISDAFEKAQSIVRGILRDVGYSHPTARDATTDSRETRHTQREQRVELYQALLAIRTATVDATVEQARRVIEGREDGERQPAGVAVPKNVPPSIEDAATNRAEAVGQVRSKTAAITSIVAAVNLYALSAYRRAGVQYVGGSPEIASDGQRHRNERVVGGDGDRISPSARGVGKTQPSTERPSSGGIPDPGDAAGYGMWKTAQDSLVCALCRPLHGRVYRLAEVIDGNAPRPPLHPNCRCLIIPLREV